jgi:hypothetical protein
MSYPIVSLFVSPPLQHVAAPIGPSSPTSLPPSPGDMCSALSASRLVQCIRSCLVAHDIDSCQKMMMLLQYSNLLEDQVRVLEFKSSAYDQVYASVTTPPSSTTTISSRFSSSSPSIDLSPPPSDDAPTPFAPLPHVAVIECGAGAGTCSFWFPASTISYIVRARLVTDRRANELPIGLCFNDICGQNTSSKIQYYRDLVKGKDYISVRGMPRPFASKKSAGGGSQTCSCVLTLSGIDKMIKHFHMQPRISTPPMSNAPTFLSVLESVAVWIRSRGTTQPTGFCFPWIPITIEEKSQKKHLETDSRVQTTVRAQQFDDVKSSTSYPFTLLRDRELSPVDRLLRTTSSTLSSTSSLPSSPSRKRLRRHESEGDSGTSPSGSSSSSGIVMMSSSQP